MIVNEREKTIYQQGFMAGSNAAQAAIKAAERRAEVAERRKGMTIECIVLMMVFATTSIIIGLVYVSYMYMKDTNKAEQQIKEVERRAEVAERALQYAVSEYRCDECPCPDCNAEIRGSQECIDCICEEYKKQAEKELAEEKR